MLIYSINFITLFNAYKMTSFYINNNNMANQFKCLLIKNIQLMSRQKGTMTCQVITPLLCLLFIYMVKLIVETQIKKTPYGLKLSIPYLFNIPIYSKLKYAEQIIRVNSCDEWYLYNFGPNAQDEESRAFFGKNDGRESSGMLSSQRGVLQQSCPTVKKMSPYFQNLEDIKQNKENTTNEFLYNRLDELNKLDYNELKNDSVINRLPDGAITINQINNKTFSYKMQINDNRLSFYHRSNGVTQFDMYNENTKNYTYYSNVLNGMIWATDLFNKAYISKLYPNVTLISGVQLMPIKLDDNEDNIQRIINMAGSTFYPMAVSLLMPLFMYSIVLEKENKLIEIMKINGLKMRFYWMNNFIFNYIVYAITMIIFIIVGTIGLNLTLFTSTHPLLLILTFVSWGVCQVGLAFFYQAFLSNARSATIIGYMVSLWTTIIASSLNFSIYDLPEKFPIPLLMYPTFALCRVFYYMTLRCGFERCIDNLSDVNDEMIICFVLLFVMGFVFLFLGIYLYEIIPQEFGVRKSPRFCCKKQTVNKEPIIQKVKNEDYDDLGISKEEGNIIPKAINIDNLNNIQLDTSSISDDDIKREVEKVQAMQDFERQDYPLVVQGLTKVYDSNKKSRFRKLKKSLDNFTICLNKNEIFGLLGPNGAGKTTFFSLLTGIYEPTSGNAWVCGNSIIDSIERVQEKIGYCPQFDLLWEDLSVEEHLYFYSKLKNVKIDSIDQNVENTLQNLKLEKFRKFLVRELSGGMKRRLSLGISLVGNPSIVFLDEPTTGLDPENKRQIWDILANCKQGKCMILTTHLMDEAEILSDRIGIIVHGHLKCLGSQYKLKKVYGKGFKLTINLIPFALIEKTIALNEDEFIEDRKEGITKFVKDIFPGATLSEAYKNTMIFEISNEEFDAEILFTQIEEKKESLYITNWAISQVSLEDIFIRLTENDL